MSFVDAEPELEVYRFASKTRSEKDHILERRRNILAQFSEITPAVSDVFKMLNDADINSGTIKNEDGNEVTLTRNYISFMQSQSQT